MSRRKWTVGTASLLLACTPKIGKDATPELSASPVAIFAPDPVEPCNSVLPFPSDLAKNPLTGKLDIPDCAGDDAMTAAMKAGLRTLDGYSLNTAIYTRFTKPLDPATLNGLTVLLINETTLSLVPMQAIFRDNADTPDPSDDNTLYIIPQSHLDEHTTYIAAVTTDVTDVDGTPLISDQAFTFIKSKTPLVDERGFSATAALDDASANALEEVRQAFAPIFEGFETNAIMPIPRSELAVVWPFTTQTVHASLGQLAGLVTAGGITVTQDDAVAPADLPQLASMGLGGDLGCVYTGRLTLNNLLTSTGTFGLTAAGAPVVTSIDVDYLFTTPAGAACGDASAPAVTAAASKVAIFVHGLGRCKNDALALADRLGAQDWATLSLDGPFAGSRVVENLGDQDMDGCADQPATPELIAIGDANPNPFAVRDNLREWALEIVQAAAAATNDAWSFAGLTKPDGGTTTIALIGHSWGGMAAALAGSVAQGVSDVVTNAASGELGAVFQPLLQQGIAAELEAAGVNVSSAEGQALLASKTLEAVTSYRWALEPADPLYAAEAWPSATKALAQAVASNGGMVTDAPLHGTDTQLNLAQVLNPATTTLEDVTFDMADSTNGSYCDSSMDLVGSLLMPCASATSANFLLAVQKYVQMQKQAVNFLVTDGSVCQPASCP